MLKKIHAVNANTSACCSSHTSYYYGSSKNKKKRYNNHCHYMIVNLLELTSWARISFQTAANYTSTTKSHGSDTSISIKTWTFNKARCGRSNESTSCSGGCSQSRNRQVAHFNFGVKSIFPCFCEAVTLRIITSKLITEWCTMKQ